MKFKESQIVKLIARKAYVNNELTKLHRRPHHLQC